MERLKKITDSAVAPVAALVFICAAYELLIRIAVLLGNVDWSNAVGAAALGLVDGIPARLSVFMLSALLLALLKLAPHKREMASAACSLLTARLSLRAASELLLAVIDRVFPQSAEGNASGYLTKTLSPAVGTASACLDFVFTLALLCILAVMLTVRKNEKQ